MRKQSFQEKRQIAIEEKDIQGKYLPQGLPTILKNDLKNRNGFQIEIKEDKGFFFYGDTGIGKSYQAAYAANELAKLRNDPNAGFWVNIPKLLHQIKRSFGTNQEDLIEKYSSVPILCLDDLGSEQSSDWVMQTLYIIINSRYEEMLTTIITSNLSPLELSEKMKDNRLISRISSMCEVLEVKGKDKRKKVI